jgi:hypothetical protein
MLTPWHCHCVVFGPSVWVAQFESYGLWLIKLRRSRRLLRSRHLTKESLGYTQTRIFSLLTVVPYWVMHLVRKDILLCSCVVAITVMCLREGRIVNSALSGNTIIVRLEKLSGELNAILRLDWLGLP